MNTTHGNTIPYTNLRIEKGAFMENLTPEQAIIVRLLQACEEGLHEESYGIADFLVENGIPAKAENLSTGCFTNANGDESRLTLAAHISDFTDGHAWEFTVRKIPYEERAG
jgi:hypothetical protein